MSYCSDTRKVGIVWLRAWRNVPRHLGCIADELRDILGSMILLFAAVFRLCVSLTVPFLFWLAPVLAPWFRYLQDREDAKAAKAREEMLKARHSLQVKAWEGME